MTSNGVVKLRTGFEIAHDDLTKTLGSLRALPMNYRCMGMPELLRKHLDASRDLGRNWQIQTIAATGLLVDKDGAYVLAENVGEVLLAMSGFESKEAALEYIDRHHVLSCSSWRFDEEALTLQNPDSVP